MDRWVEIQFDCIPLRTVSRLDIPIDASPIYRQRCERVKGAIEKHGSHNSYYLCNARCTFHLLNDPDRGRLSYRFEGTLLTDAADLRTQQTDLEIQLEGETCDWLTEPVTQWFMETVARAVAVEFDRYIAAGDLERTRERLEKLDAQSDGQQGFVGMYL